jgi:tagaturonate reductase
MQVLNKKYFLENISPESSSLLELPERVLQFGTGVLLRALPDYYIDHANKHGNFNGRIAVVKSTAQGGSDTFETQDNLYTIGLIGYTSEGFQEKYVVNSSIACVLNANTQWHEVLQRAINPQINIIISNTTEKGIELINESIELNPPHSFPAKLLSCLVKRFEILGNTEESKVYILPTELINQNGDVLREIIVELIKYNQLSNEFIFWFDNYVSFHNTLVDRIVPGSPKGDLIKPYLDKLGYTDNNIIIAEPYNLWAIEGGDDLREVLSFSDVNQGIKITNDITKYKELKLRLLNAAHSFTAAYGIYRGLSTVSESMVDDDFKKYLDGVFAEIIDVLDDSIPMQERIDFKDEVIHRFSNPELKHYWTSIILNYTDKFKVRCMPLICKYFEKYQKLPIYMTKGLHDFLSLSVPDELDGNTYYKIVAGHKISLNDPQSQNINKVKVDASIDAAKEYIIQELLGLNNSELQAQLLTSYKNLV